MDRQLTITLTEGGKLTGDIRMLNKISNAFLIESTTLKEKGLCILSREARTYADEIYNALNEIGFYDEAKKQIAEDLKRIDNREEEAVQ